MQLLSTYTIFPTAYSDMTCLELSQKNSIMDLFCFLAIINIQYMIDAMLNIMYLPNTEWKFVAHGVQW